MRPGFVAAFLGLLICWTLIAGLAGWGAGARAAEFAGDYTRAARDLSQAFFASERSKPGPRATAMSVGVSRGGALLFGAGLGDARPHQSASIATPYRVGSITKQFTALALLDLIDRGALGPDGTRVSLDTPVSHVLPQLYGWDDATRPRVLIRHLLSMTANVPNFTRRPPRGLDPWEGVREPELLSAIAAYVPTGPPIEFEYSNTCYFLIAEIIEALVRPLGESFEAQVMKAAVKPSGLRVTRFWSLPGDAALPTYSRRPAFVSGVWLKGSADLVSSVEDVLAWNAALMREETFSRSLRERLFSEAARVSVDTWYGMGWFRREKEGVLLFTHSGSVPGYTSFSVIAQRRDGAWTSAVVLTNGDDVEDIGEFAEELALMALDQGQ